MSSETSRNREGKWSVCWHVETIEDTYYEQEGMIEETIERIIIQDNGVDSTSGCSDNSESKVGVLLEDA